MINTPVRLGVVGTGLIWLTTHTQALEKIPESFDVVALCARSESSRQAASAGFPEAEIYADYELLTQAPNVDAVVVCTPIGLNSAVTISALESGKDVFVEKPFAASTTQADAVIAAEKSSGRRVFILEQLLYTEIWQVLKQILDSGEIGSVVSWDKVSCGFLDTKIDPWGYGRTSWRVAGEFPLGPLFDGGVHELALHAYLFGPVSDVVAQGQSLRPEHGEFDNIQMLLTHESGVIGMFAHSGYLGGTRNPFTIRGTQGLIAIDSESLTVEPKIDGTTRVIDARLGNLHDNMWRTLARLIASGEQPYYTTEKSSS